MALNTLQYVEQYRSSRLYTQNVEVKAAVDAFENRLKTEPDISMDQISAMVENLYTLVIRVLGSGVAAEGPNIANNETVKKYNRFVENLTGLNDGDKEKLKRIPFGYDDAVVIARKQARNPNLTVPSLDQTLNEMMKLQPEVLREIAQFGKPTLLMNPANSMAEKEQAMNEYKPYVDAAGNVQNNMGFGEDKSSELWGKEPTKLQITITDGMPTMPQLSADLLAKKWGDRYKAIYADLKSRNLRMITAHQYASLEQMSLMNYERAKQNKSHLNNATPEKEIVDFYVPGQNEVVIVFDLPETALTNLQKIPCGYFDSGYRRVYFLWTDSSDERDDLRFRPSVQVFEF